MVYADFCLTVYCLAHAGYNRGVPTETLTSGH